MSKYPVTVEQYASFCEATGRPKPWGREQRNLPVAQVTWYDAAWECRSAYRGGAGLYPGTRGTGIGFRIVKDK